MKTILAFAIFISAFKVNATTIIVQAIGTTSANEEFNPQVVNAVCGDTIRWVLVSGTHTTASTNIPPGATPWVSNNITTSGYIYVVNVAGTYNYTCHPQNGGHMDASLIVTCTTDIPYLTHVNTSSIFPNPSNGKITINKPGDSDCQFELFNVMGKKVYQSQIENLRTETEMIVPNGVYYYVLKSENKSIEKGSLVIQN